MMRILYIVAILCMPMLSEQGSSAAHTPIPEIEPIVRTFKGELGICAKNLRTGEEIAINADTRFPTASTIKIAVMLEVYHQVAEGTLALDTTIPLRDVEKVGGSGVLNRMHDGLALTVGDLLHLMIVLSDNTATNMLIGRVGTANVNARLDTYRLKNIRLFRPTFRDGKPEVLPELEQEFGLGMATPREMAALMGLIADGKAVSPAASKAMAETLRRQQDRAMIPRLLPQDGLQIGNKTGTDEEKHPGPDGVRGHVRADAALVTGEGTNYVIAIFARRIQDRRWGIDNDAVVTGARISRIIHDYFHR
jgi:beta-lactamase class A